MCIAISRVLVCCALALGMAACGINSINLPPPPAEPPAYRLAAGDKVAVQVFGHADQSGQYEVTADGTLSLPLIGSVPARERTVDELSADLRTRMDRFIVNPRFTVEVVTYRQIFVLGEVKSPGAFPYHVGLTVQQAVALAGGFSYRAITDKVVLTRLAEGGTRDYGAAPKDLVLPGDTLTVMERVF
ncbi:MAG: polysaccharide export protein [Proteobacteria bacterium]|nr:polysaccharide export protein [Pseudomonadota bacterium]MBI3497940.1 polysaccharide export protein [Pseudomonadota bacterium]